MLVQVLKDGEPTKMLPKLSPTKIIKVCQLVIKTTIQAAVPLAPNPRPQDPHQLLVVARKVEYPFLTAKQIKDLNINSETKESWKKTWAKILIILGKGKYKGQKLEEKT